MTSSSIIPFQIAENQPFPKEWEKFWNQYVAFYPKLAKASNSKDIGIYELTEILNGQKFFGATPQVKRDVYRKCFAFGAIAAGATLNIAHGVANLTNLTRLYGTCVTAVVDYRPIPFVDITLITNQIMVLLAGANIVIVNGATAPNITSGICVVEYIKQ